MDQGHIAYVVFATLHGADSPSPELSEVVAGQPVVRLLNRMERVAHAFDGKLVRRGADVLLISFDSATSAIRGSCEMQHRCSGLPQLSGNRLSLQIGIHRAILESPLSPSRQSWSGERIADHRNHARRAGFDAASRLALLAPEGQIAVSGPVLEAFAPAMKKISTPIASARADLAAYAFHWKKALTLRVLTPPPSFPARKTAPSRLVLRQGERLFELGQANTQTVIGRDPGSDVVITDRFASRTHACIRIDPEAFVLSDQSANGTSIRLDGGEEFLLKGESFTLTGRGRIAFGHRVGTGDHFEFVVLDGQEQGMPFTRVRQA